MSETPAFPPRHVYALAHRCPTCRTAPEEPCNAPLKEAEYDRRSKQRDHSGLPQMPFDPGQLIHIRRQDLGDRHRARDEDKAPPAEQRVPGQRYDTLKR